MLVPGELNGKHRAYRWQSSVSSQVTGGMWVYMPPNYAGPQASWPLLINLHGSGQVGADNASELSNAADVALVQELNGSRDVPMLVVSPQASQTLRWDPRFVHEVVQIVQANWRVDNVRIYVAGFSLGGFGTFNYAVAHPEIVAAVVPMAGGFNGSGTICGMLDVHVWAFHGSGDDVVSVSWSQNTMSALQACGGAGQKTLTIWQGYSHYGWAEVYQGQWVPGSDIYVWLASKSK